MAGRGSPRSRWFRADRRAQDGAVAVEFALVLPLVIMLLLGITTAGVSYSHAIGVTNAVREGARFGATTDATSANWANDVISRVRATQFDDPGGTPATAICVQLWKSTGQVAGTCSQGDGSVSPALALPATATANPKVPSGLPADACVVRVIAARNFTISLGVFPSWNKTTTSFSVARYERMDKVPSCK